MMKSLKPINALLLNDTSVDFHHGSKRVCDVIDYLCQESGIQIARRIPAHQDWKTDDKYKQYFDEVDIVIVNGEGTLHHGRPYGRFLLEAGEYAAQRGKPAALINASWQANPVDFVHLARHFSIVSFRDEKSAAEFGASGQPCRVVGDLTMINKNDLTSSKNRSGIGFTDAIAWKNSERLFDWAARSGATSVPIVYPAPYFMGNLRFFSSSISKRDVVAPLRLLKKLKLRFNQFQRHVLSDREYRDLLSSYKLIVSARFHTATLCLLTRTPVIALLPPSEIDSTDHNKLVSLMTESGVSKERIIDDIKQLTPDLIQNLSQWRSGEIESLTAYLNKTNSKARNLFGDIYSLVKK